MSAKYGGANARPFETQHVIEGRLFLRIAPELYLKQLVVGGLDRVYELGRVFRNEGTDADHNPEFTSLEFYQAYSNCEEMMRITEEMLGKIGERLESRVFEGPFQRVEITEALEERLGTALPVEEPEEDQQRILIEAARRKGYTCPEGLGLARTLDKLIGRYLEPFCTRPTFLVGHPMALSPLAKERGDSPHLADRFELFVNGRELANGFSEQNDPTRQLEAFRRQAIAKAAGDPEAQPLDKDFVEVLKAGLPPTGGCGIGIDRLVMMLAGAKHIRDVLAFPLVRPKQT